METETDIDYSHPTWLAAAGTGGAYLLILLAMFVLLFVVPYLVFLLF